MDRRKPSLRRRCGLAAGFSRGLWVSVAFLWLMLVFGASLVPSVAGMIIACVRPEMRPFSAAFSATVYNVRDGKALRSWPSGNPVKARQGARRSDTKRLSWWCSTRAQICDRFEMAGADPFLPLP